MAKQLLWILMAVLSILVGLFPAAYFLNDRSFGLLSSKSNELLSSIFWNAGFYTHIIFGGLALLIGWVQFSSKMRNKNINLHRQFGKAYVLAVFLSSLAAFYISLFANGGFITSLGFGCLAIIWFYTTAKAYWHIRNKELAAHQKMMVYSYAACFSAVTLRIWLPLLTAFLGDYITAYTVVSWFCWVPNLIAARLIVKRILLKRDNQLQIKKATTF